MILVRLSELWFCINDNIYSPVSRSSRIQYTILNDVQAWPADSGNELEGFLGNGDDNGYKEEVILPVSFLDISSRILSLVRTLQTQAHKGAVFHRIFIPLQGRVGEYRFKFQECDACISGRARAKHVIALWYCSGCHSAVHGIYFKFPACVTSKAIVLNYKLGQLYRNISLLVKSETS